MKSQSLVKGAQFRTLAKYKELNPLGSTAAKPHVQLHCWKEERTSSSAFI